jgi:hypothetical protein
MNQLSVEQIRVLGVLIEKAMTTPDQYPLSLNATMNGCNQKNNRDPVLSLDEDAVFDALEELRVAALVVRTDAPGMRVHKYRHLADQTLKLNPRELAVMAELMLRGPQTLGELRGRAGRMHALETLEAVKTILCDLAARDPALVRQLPPAPGSRAERYQQLLCPEDIEDGAGGENGPAETDASDGRSRVASPHVATQNASVRPDPAGAALLAEARETRITQLEGDVAALKQAFRRLAESLGDSSFLESLAANGVPATGPKGREESGS